MITVNGPDLPVDSVTFSNLTVLKLSLGNTVLLHRTLSEFRDVLAACPELRALCIPGYWFQLDRFPTGLEGPIEPVHLPKLELLDLRRADSADELLKILSCVRPGSNSLTFSVSLQDMHEIGISSLQDFIIRSNVTRLLLEDGPHFDEEMADRLFPHFTTAFAAVQELAVYNYDFEDPDIDRLSHAFPSLHTAISAQVTAVT
ncbi:hypothetical protein FRC07_001092 [Ceratobasidium sp. 392]|nr:hypothetical protein FRC07_001092 [Ceratobasidium sp. 392]